MDYLSSGRENEQREILTEKSCVMTKNALNHAYKRQNVLELEAKKTFRSASMFECGFSAALRAKCQKLAEEKEFSRINHRDKTVGRNASEKKRGWIAEISREVTENQD
ncbi:hypothetical protein HNY73_005486 [Argiope bruennichi]|uniref:Uncharacterized protein n=1 Tax=Argiope bruennichi TaxID=94029 RepID=A0A8T0FJR2_ARGBR|nr:hypothetical protein HNY73_005486 [Argiope bruennichi]